MSDKRTKSRKIMGVLLHRPFELQDEGNQKILMHASVVEVAGSEDQPEIRVLTDDDYQDLGIRFVVWADGHTLIYTRYEKPYDVDLDRGRAMVRKLQAVEKALAKFTKQLGEPGDGTDHFLRTVNALGATRIVEPADEDTLKFSGNRYRVWSLADGAARLRREMAETLQRWAAARVPAALPA